MQKTEKNVTTRTTTFTLSDKDIKSAIYDYLVKELRSSNINAYFSENDIKLATELNGRLEASLTITDEIIEKGENREIKKDIDKINNISTPSDYYQRMGLV